MNYDPATARVTWLFQKRTVPGPTPQHGMNLGGNKAHVLDILPYYRIEFDTDLPGEPTVFYEPFSEREGTTSGADTNLPSPYAYPIKGIEILESQPNIDVFGFNLGV